MGFIEHFDNLRDTLLTHLKYLKPGGILIIEDIFKSIDEDEFEKKIEPIKKYFDTISFIETDHEFQYTGNWNNEKLLVMYRNNKNV